MVELVGTLVTAYGLLYAYGRAKGLREQLRDWWARIRREPRHATVHAPAAFASTGTLTADAYAKFQLGETLPIPEQLAQLENYVCELRGMFGLVNSNIARLDRAIEQSNAHADTVAAQALTDAKREIDRFGDRLDELQAVDLSVASIGVLITAVGVFLSFWA